MQLKDRKPSNIVLHYDPDDRALRKAERVLTKSVEPYEQSHSLFAAIAIHVGIFLSANDHLEIGTVTVISSLCVTTWDTGGNYTVEYSEEGGGTAQNTGVRFSCESDIDALREMAC